MVEEVVDPLATPCHHGNKFVCGHCLREAVAHGHVLNSAPNPEIGYNIMRPGGMRAALGAARSRHADNLRHEREKEVWMLILSGQHDEAHELADETGVSYVDTLSAIDRDRDMAVQSLILAGRYNEARELADQTGVDLLKMRDVVESYRRQPIKADRLDSAD